MNRRWFLNIGLTLGLAGLLFMGVVVSIHATAQPAPAAPPASVAPLLWEATAAGDETEFLVIMAQQADLGAAAGMPTREARLHYVYDALRATALRSQAALRAELDAAGVAYRSFYLVNMLAVRGDRALVTRLAARPEVARLAANPRVRQPLPQPPPDGVRPLAPQGVEWNVEHIGAEDVWPLGYSGQGIVVAGQDTGYDWDHPALIRQYRGYDGVTATHDYNWHDAIHTNDSHTDPGNPCGFDSPVPCDDDDHGTHTMGTIVGDDGAGNQIGVAPGARWIGCRNMEEEWGTPATYIECFEFFLAPYPVGGDPFTEGIPSLAPHVINNSWTCPPREGCDPDTLQTAVENVRAAGIVVVASAGNDGSACETVQSPPAIYDAAFSVGASTSGDDIASFSSRGPVTVDGSGRLKPDVTAPGVGIRSSRNGGGYYYNQGTSMAGPHVAGTVALLWSAAPHLAGDVSATEWVITATARPHTTTQACGGDGPDDVPNNVYGWGVVDALAAVQKVISGLEVTKAAAPDPVLPGAQLTYTLRVTNTGSLGLHVMVTDTLPAHITPGRTEGGTVIKPGGSLTWTSGLITPGGVWTETVVVTVAPGYEGTLTNVVRATAYEGASGIYTATSRSLAPHPEVTKEATPVLVPAGSRLVYTLRVTNTSVLTLTQAVLTDALPTGAVFAGASGGATQAGGIVTWPAVDLAPGGRLTATLAVTVEVPPGTYVVNAAYGVRAGELVAPVMGGPVAAMVPWRCFLPLAWRDGTAGGSGGG